ncbi:(2Fe-2S)-binding protein [Pseudemcibacter aquimaris]|uniref:(2Fe-2S)-binding protein n=1 Tax=Pseudemcibacter aquimaris TaxID=2857064 RepID=UPI00201281F1|nr:(2Fe-2S)-binding protein [Pseudemcibacter aquimaris]MCC3862005.1 (2Fe-2S)-binding protein [Pseudemcibacter aquimaris]WDU58757.1 (2Fe-2S)-binding protein [Pseudemcibacter aquimaris]
MVSLKINGKNHDFNGDEEMPLLWYLREEINLSGAKFGCGIGSCGACTVNIDGQAVRSCIISVKDAEDANITTIEGLEKENNLHPVQRAWIDEDVAQCGYCQSGQIMATVAFLNDHPNPTDQDINENISNLCRCATYSRIRKAIHKSAEYMAEEKS